jgi:catechol 2,3-dioxygenase-like lactoylglutathione lyase family enzyme
MAKVSVRYIVNDVDAAIDFYCQRLGFHEDMHPAPTFAMLSHGDLRLVLSAPGGGPGGGQAMPDGTKPEPGGWNRFQLEVVDIEATVAELRKHGARFRNDIITGVGGNRYSSRTPLATQSSSSSQSLPRRSSHAPPEPSGGKRRLNLAVAANCS